MGKRKSKSKVVKAKKAGLRTVFDCLFCDDRDSVEINIRQGIGSLRCRGCNARAQYNVTFISKPVDVYAEWLDETVQVNKLDENDGDYDSEKRSRYGEFSNDYGTSPMVQLPSNKISTFDVSNSALHKKITAAKGKSKGDDTGSIDVTHDFDDPDEYDGEGIETEADRDFVVDDEEADVFDGLEFDYDDIDFGDDGFDNSDGDDGDDGDGDRSGKKKKSKIKKKKRSKEKLGEEKTKNTASTTAPSSSSSDRINITIAEPSARGSEDTPMPKIAPLPSAAYVVDDDDDDDDDDDAIAFTRPSAPAA